ncbi:MAG: hypothetical protein O7F08_13635 [Deltaproteobacteria bacterium]|nr:hypothetical protein [Deltaproteobacteria bacterium]
MSEPTPPEQTTAKTDLAEEAITRATSEGGIWDQSWAWVELNWLNLMAGVPAILATILLVEITKEWVKLIAAKRLGDSYDDKIENLLIRTWTVPCALVWVATLDFTSSWNQMTGSSLYWWQGMLLGTTLTTGAAWGLVWLVGYLKMAETARVRFQRLTGVTKDDIEEAKTTRAQPAVTPDMIASDREDKGIDPEE